MPQIASSKSFHNKFLLSVFGDAKEQLIIGLNSDNHLMINTHRMHKTGKSNLYTQYFDMISKQVDIWWNVSRIKRRMEIMFK